MFSVNTDPQSVIVIAPSVLPNGKPAVTLIIKKSAPSFQEALINGEPAISIVLSEESPGHNNGPWEIGHLLAQQWEEAVKLAQAQASV